jgi:hypothetical protein
MLVPEAMIVEKSIKSLFLVAIQKERLSHPWMTLMLGDVKAKLQNMTKLDATSEQR